MIAAAAQLSARLLNTAALSPFHGRGGESVGSIKLDADGYPVKDAPYSNTGERSQTKGSEKPVVKDIAFIDYLTFTFSVHKMKALKGYIDMEDFAAQLALYFLNDFGLTYDENIRGGRNGYQHHWKILSKVRTPNRKTAQFTEVGYFAFGGNNDTVCVSLSGSGCQCIGSAGFSLIREFLEDVTGKITRIDLAHDCLNGEVSLDDVALWYDAGLFRANTRGKYPNMKMLSDCGGGQGSTIYVGSRDSGKLFRAYEKGKQLGDKNSKWVRLELELHSTKRGIPYEILDRVSDYLAGAYDCMAFVSTEQSRIQTTQKAHEISFNHLEEYCKQSYGRFIEVMLSVYDGCPATVIDKLRRTDALPARLAQHSIPVRE